MTGGRLLVVDDEPGFGVEMSCGRDSPDRLPCVGVGRVSSLLACPSGRRAGRKG